MRNTYMVLIKAFVKNEDGATAIEYGLLAALLGAALITALNGMGNSLKSTFSTTSSQMSVANASAS